MDYAVLYGAALLDCVLATGDTSTGRNLWPVVRRQLEIIGQSVNQEGLFVDPRNLWIFIDWNNELDRTAAMHGVLLYSYKRAIDLARVIGAEKDTIACQDQISRMTKAARTHFFDSDHRLFVSGPDRQISWASQAWLVLAGVCEKEEGAAAIKNTIKLPNTVRPVTPYLYHHVVDAMIACGMKNDARDLIQSY
jgi:alpha-L-rhamnosidase